MRRRSESWPRDTGLPHNGVAEDLIRLPAGSGALALGTDGAFRLITRGPAKVDLPYAPAQSGLDGADCAAEAAWENGSFTARLTGRRAAGVARITSDREVHVQVTVDGEKQEAARGIKRASLSFSLAADAGIHLAEFQNVGRLINASMLVGEWFTCRLYFNRAVIEAGGLALRAWSDHRDTGQLEVEIQRHPDSFTVTFTWPTAGASLGQTDCEGLRDGSQGGGWPRSGQREPAHLSPVWLCNEPHRGHHRSR